MRLRGGRRLTTVRRGRKGVADVLGRRTAVDDGQCGTVLDSLVEDGGNVCKRVDVVAVVDGAVAVIGGGGRGVVVMRSTGHGEYPIGGGVGGLVV